MDIFVDGQSIDGGFVENITTVEQAVQHIQADVCGSDRMVVSLRCDGQAVPAEAMTDTLSRSISSFDRLDIATGTKSSLVIEAMEQASTCLSETEAACRQTAEMLTEGKTAEAAQSLRDCLRVWQQIHEAVAHSIEMLRLDLEQATVNDRPLLEIIGRPRDALLQVRDALQSQDYVLLADILQYEFSEVTDCWQAVIGRLRHEAEEVAAESAT